MSVASFKKAVVDLTWQHGGYLRCEYCGHRAALRSEYWRTGWPQHCGYTMRWWTQRQIDAGEVPSNPTRPPALTPHPME